VNVATRRAAERVLVFVAAGNESQRADERETMNPWAEGQWVVAVGATTAAEGDALAHYSSVGYPALPDSGPDFVAWGSSAVDPTVRGTSFASPRAAQQVLFLAAAVGMLAHSVERHRGAASSGVHLVGCGLVDSDFGYVRSDKIDASALPLLGVDQSSLGASVDKIDELGITLAVELSPAKLFALLRGSARPLPPYGPHQVGYGFVSDEQTLGLLSSFNGAHLAELFGDQPITPDTREALAGPPIFDGEALPDLLELTRRTAPAWQSDIESADVSRLIVEPYEMR